MKNDDYMTPASAWEDIASFLPKDMTIWEPFYGDGTSGQILKDLGFRVIHEDLDFFTHDLGEYIVTNPPFSKLPEVLKRLRELDKPFVMIMPCATLTTQYFQNIFDDVQVIVPRKRIQFLPSPSRCSFDCLYFCWKMGLEKDVVFLPR